MLSLHCSIAELISPTLPILILNPAGWDPDFAHSGVAILALASLLLQFQHRHLSNLNLTLVVDTVDLQVSAITLCLHLGGQLAFLEPEPESRIQDPELRPQSGTTIWDHKSSRIQRSEPKEIPNHHLRFFPVVPPSLNQKSSRS